MGHPVITNNTPFHLDYTIVLDDAMQPLYVGILKATFRINPDGRLTPLREQPPLNLTGDYFGEPGQSAYKYEPECTAPKLNTDIILIGIARPPEPHMPWFDCGIKVGNNARILRIFGQRQWTRTDDNIMIQPLQPAQPTQLDYAQAFGGEDSSIKHSHGHPIETRNPIGIGYHHKDGEFIEGAPLPLIEDPGQLIRHYHDTPEPAGVGFVSGHWSPRKQYAGTYDEQWALQRKPFLPRDFDQRYHNAASQGMISNGYLQGNEPVSIVNVGLKKLTFNLPAMQQPKIQLNLKTQHRILRTNLDTVIVDTDTMLLSLIYRCQHPLARGVNDILDLEAKIPGLHSQSITVV